MPLAGRRIVITTDAVGGVWRYAMDVAAGLARRGVAASLLGLGPGPSAAQAAEAGAAGVELLWLDARLDWTLTDPAAAQALACDLAELAVRAGAGLLHLNAPALAGAVEPGIPMLVAAHSCLTTLWKAVRTGAPPAEWDWHRRLTARGLRRATVATAPSAAFAADLVAVYGPLPALRVIPNGARAIAPAARKEIVLAAGRWWDPAKNVATLDAAAAHIRWPVLAAGPPTGPSGEGVPTKNLRLIGNVDPALMAGSMARAPIFVSLSLYEPFGLSVLEAATTGAALVLADIPTFRELWDGAALFVAPTDPADAARAVNALIADPAIRGRLGAAARARSEYYTLDAQVDALLAAYAGTLTERPLPVDPA